LKPRVVGADQILDRASRLPMRNWNGTGTMYAVYAGGLFSFQTTYEELKPRIFRCRNFAGSFGFQTTYEELKPLPTHKDGRVQV